MHTRSPLYRQLLRHPLLAALGYTAFHFLIFILLENIPRSDFHIVHVRLDNFIPFVPQAIIPYLAWFLWIPLWFLIFLKKDKPGYWRLLCTVAAGGIISLTTYAVWPTAVQLRRPFLADDLFTRLVALLRTSDTSTNVCPSLHVFISLAVFFAILDTGWCSRLCKWANGILCLAICASTLLLDQHSVVDLWWGGLLAVALHLFFNRHTVLLRPFGRSRHRQKQSG